jgi:hypothetical protein
MLVPTPPQSWLLQRLTAQSQKNSHWAIHIKSQATPQNMGHLYSLGPEDWESMVSVLLPRMRKDARKLLGGKHSNSFNE